MKNDASATKPELIPWLITYNMMTDCYGGARTVKAGREAYLPDPSPSAEKKEIRTTRYNFYIERAVYYNTIKPTVKKMIGSAFKKEPLIIIPDSIEYLLENADGNGNGINQQAQSLYKDLLLKGRAGLLVDFPINDGSATKADNLTPRILAYPAESIINWRTSMVGADRKLSLLVIAEKHIESEGFVDEESEQYLVYRLTNGVATAEIFREDNGKLVSLGENTIKANGVALTSLPFSFVGSVNNDESIDDAPLYDVAELSVAHFRNSADYEEGLFIAGQPTLVVSGLDQKWVNTNFADGINIGARSGLVLPQGANAQLLQATSNNVAFEAMGHKEKLMVASGAKIIQSNTQAMTATEAGINQSAQISDLAIISENVSDAYTSAIKLCAQFLGLATDDIVYSLDTDFDFNRMTQEERRQLMSEWQNDAITWEEYRNKLEIDGIVTEDAKKARVAIAKARDEATDAIDAI